MSEVKTILTLFIADTIFRLDNNSRSIYQTLMVVQRMLSYFKSSTNAIEEPLPNFDLEVINLQGSDMLKGKYQETPVIEFYKCLLRDKYTQ